MKKILIAGGTGFLGTSLENHFGSKGYDVKILTRNPTKENHVYWDGKTLGTWCKEIDQTNILINLTGKCVDCRYTEKNKKEIIQSRIKSTRVLNEAIQHATYKPEIFLNASSATIYVHAEKQLMTEENGIIGDDFSMNVCKSWEEEFFKSAFEDTRKIALRTSIVLGTKGGAFPKMKLITQLGLGGCQGNGQQYMSWIHIHDFCKAVEFIIKNEEINGAINITAPDPVRNKSFMKKLRKKIGMPFGIPSPSYVLEIGAKLIGTETELLLKSRFVFPEKLKNFGFIFEYPKINDALENI